jgi:outer membrane murein-binding lipoprotein Lpp
MAIELPGEVVSFLQFIGVNWPNVNEDKVREFASHVRDFASKVDGTHQDSTATAPRRAAAVGEPAEAGGRHRTSAPDRGRGSLRPFHGVPPRVRTAG